MLDLTLEDTIAAIASPMNASARGIIRVSGPLTAMCVQRFFRPTANGTSIQRKHAVQVSGSFALQDSLIPGQLLFWPTEQSYTRQVCAEFHLPGSLPILNLFMKQLGETGIRGARPGEFTLRAFLGGRIDLTQAEAVLAVIDAQHAASFQTALQQLAGGLANPFHAIRESLLNLVADLEAGLDFVEEDIEFVSSQQLQTILGQCLETLTTIHSQMNSRTESSGAIRVALLGHPNVGKSSLFNRLAHEALAVVSSVPGTTRDFLVARIQHKNQTIELFDTAGIDELENVDSTGSRSLEMIEWQSQSKSHAISGQSDLVVVCIDSTRPTTNWELSQWNSIDERTLVVLTKLDMEIEETISLKGIATSAKTGRGMDELLDKVVEKNRALNHNTTGWLISTNARCFESVCQATNSLLAARSANLQNLGDEIVASEIRLALESIGEIVGVVHNEEILDRLFSRFCIGK